MFNLIPIDNGGTNILEMNKLEKCQHCGEEKEDCYHGFIAICIPIPEMEVKINKWGREEWWKNLERTDLTEDEARRVEWDSSTGRATLDGKYLPNTLVMTYDEQIDDSMNKIARKWATTKQGKNKENVVNKSKTTGEPPLMLAMSVFYAIKDAVASVGEYKVIPKLDAPATPEKILMSLTIFLLFL